MENKKDKLSKSLLEQWIKHPVTNVLLRGLHDDRAHCYRHLSMLDTLHADKDLALQIGEVIGRNKLIAELIEIPESFVKNHAEHTILGKFVELTED